jgi:hypothetical protein
MHYIIGDIMRRIRYMGYEMYMYYIIMILCIVFINNYSYCKDNSVKVINEIEAVKVINDMASRNKEPKIVVIHEEAGISAPPYFINRNDGVPLFDKEYDWTKQRIVSEARHYIVENDGNDLWPYLVNNIDDKRYSLTYANDNHAFHATVGQICKWIAYKDLIYPYNQYMSDIAHDCSVINARDKLTDTYYYIIRSEMFSKDNNISNNKTMIMPPMDMDDLKTWYSGYKENKLYELQIGVCLWAIDKLKTSKIIPDQVKSKYYIDSITDNMQKIKETKTPMCRKRSPFSEDVSFFNESIAKQLREEYEAQLKATGGKDK